jgi:hypothetical protein
MLTYECWVALKESAFPNLPAVLQVVATTEPLLALPERSATVVPAPSSNE